MYSVCNLLSCTLYIFIGKERGSQSKDVTIDISGCNTEARCALHRGQNTTISVTFSKFHNISFITFITTNCHIDLVDVLTERKISVLADRCIALDCGTVE